MSDTSLLKAWAPGLVALVVLVATCDGPLTNARSTAVVADGAGETAERLQGTWLREQAGQGAQARRVLTLHADGTFQESVRVVDAAGQATHHAHEGTWLFDGTNLKRKYTSMDGQRPSWRKAPFATFQITFESRHAFVGIDHIHGNRIHYRRVAAETRP